MLHMAAKDYMPAVIRYLALLDRSEPVQAALYEKTAALLEALYRQREVLEEKTVMADSLVDAGTVARAFRVQVVPAMEALRQTVDTLELLVPRDLWPVPTYGELMFEV